MHQFDNPLVMTEEGYFVSDNWRRFASILQDFDPYLELRWIPPKNRSKPDAAKPYAICHCLPDKQPYVIRFAGELDDPIQVLADLWEGRKSEDKLLSKLDAIEKAKEAFRLKKDLEELEERTDLFHFLATNRSPFITKIHDPKTGKLIKLNTTNGRRIT